MKIKQIMVAIALLIGIGGFLISPVVFATTKCAGVDTSIIGCDETGNGGGKCPDGTVISAQQIKDGVQCPDGSKPDVVANTGVWGILLMVINILTAGIGIAAVGGIIYGSVLYASAADDPGQVKTARGIIVNVVIGLVAYALMYSFLNFIIPGGLFS